MPAKNSTAPTVPAAPDASPSTTPSPTVEIIRPAPAELAPVLDGADDEATLQSRHYMTWDFLWFKRTDPDRTPRLFDLRSSANFDPAIPVNGYSAGTVNTNPSAGFRWQIGREIRDHLAVEFGGLYVHPFFFKRTLATETIVGGGFGSNQVVQNALTFVPTGEIDDSTNIYYRSGLYALDPSARWLVFSNDLVRVDGLAGLRYLHMFERFNIDQNITDDNRFNESLDTYNNFIGSRLGVQADVLLWEYVWLRAALNWSLGVNFQDLIVRGPAPGTGRLTGVGNLGGFDDSHFGNILDFNLALVADLTPYIHALIGYNFIWIDGLVRTANTLDPANAATGTPTLFKRTDSTLLYGFNFGLKLDF